MNNLKQAASPEWKRCAVGGWITADGVWRIRGPIWGIQMYWVYNQHGRFTPTGKYNDCVSFVSVYSAKRFVGEQYKKAVV